MKIFVARQHKNNDLLSLNVCDIKTFEAIVSFCCRNNFDIDNIKEIIVWLKVGHNL